MSNLEGIAGLDYATQSDLLDRMYTNPAGVNFDNIAMYSGEDEDFFQIVPTRSVRGSGKTDHRVRARQDVIDAVPDKVIASIRKAYSDYKCKFFNNSIQGAIAWMNEKGIPVNFDSLNSYGESNALVAWLLFRGVLGNTSKNRQRIDECLMWYAKQSYCKEYYKARELLRNVTRREVLTAGKYISGGLMGDDIVSYDAAYDAGEPLFKYAAIDLIDCCMFTENYKDIRTRVVWMLNNFNRHNGSVKVHHIVKHHKDWTFDIYRYMICALYVASKVSNTKFTKERRSMQIDKYLINFGFIYRYYTINDGPTISSFAEFIDGYDFDKEKEFAEVMRYCPKPLED